MVIKNTLKKNAIFILFGMLALFLILIDTAGYNIKILYGETPEYGYLVPPISGSMITSKDVGVVSTEEVVNDRYHYGVIDSSQWIRSDNYLDINFTRQNETILNLSIEKIEFRFLFFNLFSLTKDNFKNYIQLSSNSYVNNKCLIIPFEDNIVNIHFRASDLISNSKINEKSVLVKTILCLFIWGFIILFCTLDYKCKNSECATHYKWVAILGIILLLIIISVNHGTQYCSPDEDVSSGAVRYYYNHWGLPNFNDDSVLASFSIYGNSRLKELTPYYFLAGKVGCVVKAIGVAFPYRFFNLLLFFMLAGLFIRFGKKNKWMLFGLICTPQLYYIFSYTTSDAWDYFVSYICVMFVTYIFQNRKEDNVRGHFVVGILLALIFMGKSTYYSVILYVMGIYALKVIDADKTERNTIVKKFLMVFTSFVLGVLVRNGLDYLYYGGDKEDIIKAIGIAVRTYYPVTYIERGTTLYGMITNTNLVDRLFKSFYGVYGWMCFTGEGIYYAVIFGLVIGLVSFVIFMYFKDKEQDKLLDVLLWTGVTALMIFAIVYHCWTIDYQPQGRYLFGVIPCLMHFVSNKKTYECRTVEYLLEGIVLMSIYSFVRYGMTNFVA